MLPRPLTYAILLIITAVWATNFAAALLLPGYQSDVYIHVIFMGTVGVILGVGARNGSGPKSGDGPGQHHETQNLPQLPRLPWGRP